MRKDEKITIIVILYTETISHSNYSLKQSKILEKKEENLIMIYMRIWLYFTICHNLPNLWSMPYKLPVFDIINLKYKISVNMYRKYITVLNIVHLAEHCTYISTLKTWKICTKTSFTKYNDYNLM